MPFYYERGVPEAQRELLIVCEEKNQFGRSAH